MSKLKALVPQNIKNLYHLGQAVLANVRYGFPSRKIKVIGVTGTNGKTTAVQMITRILEEAGSPVKSGEYGASKVAMASTINFKLNGVEEVNKTKFTTLSAFAVQKFIKDAVKGNHDYVVLETSSHSLDQYRVWGVKYDTAVITNVTREHLDYHKTMDKYRQAKAKLFSNVKTAIVNLDMEKPEEFLQYENVVKFGYTCHPELVSGSKMSRFRIPPEGGHGKSGMTVFEADNVELEMNYSRFKIQDSRFLLNLPGLFKIGRAHV